MLFFCAKKAARPARYAGRAEKGRPRKGDKVPRTSKLTKEEALRAAAEVVRKGGEGALNARSLAKELGCSTQPVYSLFRNMEELKEALYTEAKNAYRRFIDGYLARGGRSRYESFGMGYVKFAQEERGLFRFLFLRDRKASEPQTEDPFLDDILAEMTELYRMTEEQARAFHGDMTVYSYGLAALVNTGNYTPTDGEISECFKREFYALYAYYFPNRPKFWE